MAINDNLAEIAILIYPDSLISAIYGMSDLFRLSNMILLKHDGVKRPIIRVSHWQLKEGNGNEIERVSDTHPDLPNKPLIVIVPPSLIIPEESQCPPIISNWLTSQYEEGAVMCSVCAGSFLLAQSGLLKDRSATTHWLFAEMMTQRFPDVRIDKDKMVIDDGDIITAGGIMAWADLGLRLVHRIHGPTLMLETAKFLLIDPPGREQRFYSSFSPPLQHGDSAILKLQHWLQANGAKDVTMAAMAEKAGMEERTFLRRFQKATGMKPTEYCQHIRVHKAKEMIELSKQTIDQVAWAVGYEDAGAFRKVFQKITGLAPGEYRIRFGMAA